MTDGRLNIGLLINGMEDDFANAVCRGVAEFAEKLDFNLLIFPGNNFHSRISTISDTLFNSQHATIFSYAFEDQLDAVIISVGSIYADPQCDSAKEVVARFSHIPIVTLCFEIDGCSCVRFDAESGIIELIDHLVHTHDCQKIAFLAGDENNDDSISRLNAYKKGLEKNGIPYNENYISFADFSIESYNKVDELLDRFDGLPDAVCCANDRLASDVYKVLTRRGIAVGRDVIVTGYDNVVLSSALTPSLTTVNASPCSLGLHAARLAVDMVKKGLPPQTISLKSQLILRESCRSHKNTNPQAAQALNNFLNSVTLHNDNLHFLGLVSNFNGEASAFIELLLEQISDENTETIDQALLISMFNSSILGYVPDTLSAASICDFIRTLQTVTTNHCSCIKKRDQLATLFAELYSSVCSVLVGLIYYQMQGSRFNSFFINNITSFANSDHNASLTEIMQQICRLDIKNSYIYLAENPLLIKDPSVAQTFNELLLSAYHYGYECYVPKENIPIKLNELFSNEYIRKDERFTMIILPLFTMNEQLGLAIFDLPVSFLNYVQLMSRQLSNALESMSLLSRLNSHIEDVELRNSMLSTIASKDSLTGLYNRYGFFEHSELIARNPAYAGKRAMIAFVDMDNLKITNDTFGHEEGDYALCLINKALTMCFNPSSIIGRIGGDEFAVFALIDTNESEKEIQLRLKNILAQLNRDSGKPYDVSLSIGIVKFKCAGNVIIRSYLEQADKKLYIDKRAKPSSIFKKQQQ